MRTARPQTIESRSPRLADRIVGGLLAPAPAVKDNQHDRTALLHLPKSSAPHRRWRGAPTGIHRPLGSLCGISVALLTSGLFAEHRDRAFGVTEAIFVPWRGSSGRHQSIRPRERVDWRRVAVTFGRGAELTANRVVAALATLAVL